MSKWKRNYDYATILRQTGKKKKKKGVKNNYCLIPKTLPSRSARRNKSKPWSKPSLIVSGGSLQNHTDKVISNEPQYGYVCVISE